MPEPLKNDDKSIRSYILNDVIEKIPIDNSYEKLCEVIEDDAITFYDYQYWYYRFKDGKHNLDFDRSSEPEPFQFSDLPLDAVGLIVDELESVDRLVLRYVSKPLRDFMNHQEVDCKRIEVNCGIDFISLECENKRIIYAKNDVTLEHHTSLFWISLTKIKVFDDNYESEFFNDLAWILKNPKLQLSALDFKHYSSTYPTEKTTEEENEMIERCIKKMENVLKSLKHQVAVKWLEIDVHSPDNLLTILPHFKPRQLKSIRICKPCDRDDWGNAESARKIRKIASLDQWKQAKELKLENLLEFFPDVVLTRFERLIIHEQGGLPPGALTRLRDILVRSATLVDIDSLHLFDKREFLKISVPAPPPHFGDEVRLYMIPNSNQYLVFRIWKGRCWIVKKTHQ